MHRKGAGDLHLDTELALGGVQLGTFSGGFLSRPIGLQLAIEVLARAAAVNLLLPGVVIHP
jgi:hypothetical protein